MDQNRDFGNSNLAVREPATARTPPNDIRGRAVVGRGPISTNPNNAPPIVASHADPAVLGQLKSLTPELAAGVRRVARAR